ncbi:ABC transporter ATP-binding protein [Halegenticoccus tardaugens]|uniref:ABC transporter ATP-binding protein n=1 Tax=Halegenticoccus tardaugens TaxID=2071624 RepID=UPI00100AE972|nr:ABC transporter ATP-binding protein [Halegenticoccus tardaugens]
MGEISVDGLRKVFGDGGDEIVAVEGLDCAIEDGEFLVLVGPSGCGKSTTLRCLAGLERPTDGRIVLDGEDVTDRKPKDRNMAMVFQNYALYPHMTARENMAFGLKMTTDLSTDEIDARVEETAEMMGIEAILDKKPGELSGGQQQRVALGRAIVRDPEVFLMDEPLSNLDAKLRTQMRTELQSLQQEFGVTTVYVTHDQTEAMTMGDRIAVLKDGRLQQIGTPLECYHAPQNEFVAGFIGSPGMNFFDVVVEETGGTTTLVHEAFEYEVSEDVGADLRETRRRDAAETDGRRRATLGIRPEDIRLAEADDPNAIRTAVDVTEPLGDVTYVYFRVGDEQYTASLAGDVLLDPNSALDVSFPEDRVHLFDGRTGEALRNREPPAEDAAARLNL